MASTAKIMVVDDENRICENVEKILSKNNYDVVKAKSAQEALEKMAVESFSLLISDIVMPEMNGLELLKMVKKNWPLTKAVMMTAYASTDTAVNAIRLGALDYVTKPFTPDELRSSVDQALSGELVEYKPTEAERELVPMDVDIPFDRDEDSDAVGEQYADMMGPSDMPVVEVKMPDNLENYCELGGMVCDIFKKLGATCKAGTKTDTCPQLAKKKRKAAKGAAFDAKTLIGIDHPFNYEEVASVTGPEYVAHLDADGFSFLPYEDLKRNMQAAETAPRDTIDVDMPFDREEVAKAAGDQFADQLTRTDVPTVEITATESLENFCELGNMVCDIFKKLGATCKAGIKTSACPQLAKKKRKAAKAAAAVDVSKLVGVDMPFDYEEVAAATGPEYIDHLVYDGVVQMPYEQLKAADMARREAEAARVVPLQQEASVTKNILVIDDEVAVNNNIRKILEKKGYQVDQAVTRDEALERIAGHPYKLVLLDLKIPGVKGLELLKAIGEQQPEAKVIMITGYASIETAVESARMGAIAYLPKPFTPEEIRSATDSAMKLAA